MNPLTNVKNITKLNETELAKGTIDKKSWHDMYKESAWIFIGGLPYDLTEGDILAVFSQYGEIVNINLVRDKKTGKTKGFCFLCYANQKSTVLAVDNFNAIKICGRTIRVDHVANYKPPKEDERDDELTKILKSEGCAPKPVKLEPTSSSDEKEKKKAKKEKKKKKSKEKEPVRIKEEKDDPGYHKYEHSRTIPPTFTKEKYERSRNERIVKHELSSERKLQKKNDDGLDKYSKHSKKRYKHSSSDDDSPSDENLDRKKTRKPSDSISKTKDSACFDHSAKSNDQTEKYTHDSVAHNSRHRTSHISRDLEESEKYESKHKSRQYHSSSYSDEDKSERSRYHEQSSSRNRDNRHKYSEIEKHKYHSRDSDRTESDSKYKKHRSK